jgi:hypothetical protein
MNYVRHIHIIHAKCQLSSFYPAGLTIFLTIFQLNFRIFQKNSEANLKIIRIWICCFMLQLSKHVHAKFQLSSFYPDGFRNFFDIFSRKFQSFSEELLSELLMLQLSKHVYAKFSQLSSFYPDGRKYTFLIIFQVNFRIFSRKFQSFLILKKFQLEHPKRHLLPKI